jgi:predicted site-specific integrase-resolvase
MISTNGHGPWRAIMYGRVSTDEQARSGYSLAQQMEALREYADLEGYEVVEEVTDPGESGASLERPGMDRVRDLVDAGGISVVLAQDRDRIARKSAYIHPPGGACGARLRTEGAKRLRRRQPGRKAYARHTRPVSRVRAGEDS